MLIRTMSLAGLHSNTGWLQAPEMLRSIAIPRVVADWAQCTWLYDNLTNVTTSPMQRVIATELRQLGAENSPTPGLHALPLVPSKFSWGIFLRCRCRIPHGGVHLASAGSSQML